MVLDVGVIIFFIAGYFIGSKRGFIYSFFSLFKYLLIIFFMDNFYSVLRTNYRIESRTEDHQLKIFITVFLILYVITTILLIVNRRFLKTIKLKKYDSFFGGVVGLIKVSFLILVIYVIIVMGSLNSRRIRKIRDESITVDVITEYIDVYEKGFPDFISKNIEIYRKKIIEKKIGEKILKDFKERGMNTEKFSEEKDENKNNR